VKTLGVSLALHAAAGAACLSLAIFSPAYEEPVEMVSADMWIRDAVPAPAEIPPTCRETAIEWARPERQVQPTLPLEEKSWVLSAPILPDPVPDAGFEAAVEDRPLRPIEIRFPATQSVPAHPRVVHNPKPVYPWQARKRGWEGSVIVRVDVDAEGKCRSARVMTSSGHHILDQAALGAVASWTFEPGRAGSIDLTFEFKLE
jgi:protein TonB